jgi:uncharacterized protein with PQ loop repeat
MSQLSTETKRNIQESLRDRISGFVAEKVAIEKQFDIDLSKFIYLTGVVGPILAIIQLVNIFLVKSSAGISYYYWVGYLILAAMWLTYGIYYHNKPIITVYSVWVLIIVLMINAIILYS